MGGQKDTIIGAFSLCRNFEDWIEEVYDVLEEFDSELDSDRIDGFLDHFMRHVIGEIIDEYDLLDQDEYHGDMKGGYKVLDRIQVKYPAEQSLPISKLKNTHVEVPPGNWKYFKILPVNYNRGGSDVGIAFLTSEGNKIYGDKIAGDY